MSDALPQRLSLRARRPGPWFVVALLLFALAAPSGLAAAHVVATVPAVGLARGFPGVGSTVQFTVNLTDTPAFEPSLLNATQNGRLNVSVRLDNLGAMTHTFTVVNLNQSGVVLNRSWSPERLDQYFAENGSLANVSVPSGGKAYANFTLNASSTPRSFEFVSVLPYQFQAGMWGFLNVTPLGPTYVAYENTTSAPGFVPNVLSAPPGAHGVVTFHILITNLGPVAESHTFTLSAQSNATITSTGYFSNHAPLVNAPVPAVIGGTVWANFTVPGSGIYEYICTVSGHFLAGMYGLLYVGVPVPPPPPTPSTAIVAIPVLLGAAVLLGIGATFALGSALAGRLPKKPSSKDVHP